MNENEYGIFSALAFLLVSVASLYVLSLSVSLSCCYAKGD